MTHPELQSFIAVARERGAGDEFLASVLKRRGWPASDVYGALADWWEQTTGVAIPSRASTAENARDAFLYLLSFSMLATWASALGALWFRLIEHWLPDPVVNAYPYFRATIAWQTASILVALPIYLFTMRVILRETKANPDRIESGVRKWLTYIALLLTACGLVSDLVCFLDSFLKGELTPRFVLKCLTVLLLCGAIFWYYLGFLRGRVRSTVFAAAAVGTALAAVGLGLTVTGTPSTQRRMAADEQRVRDLREIATELSSSPSLPSSLKSFAAARPRLRVADPETRAPYDYIVSSDRNYAVCANFSAADDAQCDDSNRPPYQSAFWSHPQGRTCFAFELGRPVPW